EMLRSEPNSANIPIIFLTGRSDRESVMTVMALKPQGYMLKSMTKEQILETIDNFFLTKKWNNT
ncbi:MAG: response regulator, partial [Ruminiclostridium sp.]|nr:response regulator [Ruminiclostridium sp.]